VDESFFTDDTYYTSPPLTDGQVASAEAKLGYRLPTSYVELLKVRNGGEPQRTACPTSFPNSWAPDHIEISAIRGIGGEWGIDSTDGLGSADLIVEWGYPKIGVVFCATPSAGHDTVMLDYSECGPDGEPSVAYIDEDRIPRRIADSFAHFLTRLAPAEQFDIDLPPDSDLA
jgi:hypothetical protein